MIRCGMNKICFLTPPDGQSFLCANPHVQAGTHPKRNVPRRGKHPPSYARHGAACRPGSCRAHYGGAWCAPFQAPGERRVSTPNFVEWRNIGPLRQPDPNPFDVAPYAKGMIGRWVPPGFQAAPAEAQTAVWASAWAKNVAEELRAARTDLVVADFVLLGALAAAEASDTPAVALMHTVAPRPGLDAGSRPLRSGSGCDWPRLYRIPTSPQCATATE